MNEKRIKSSSGGKYDSYKFDGYLELGMAVIIQACKDYYRVCNKNTARALYEKSKLENFFLNGMYDLYSADLNIDGQYLINRIKYMKDHNIPLNNTSQLNNSIYPRSGDYE